MKIEENANILTSILKYAGAKVNVKPINQNNQFEIIINDSLSILVTITGQVVKNSTFNVKNAKRKQIELPFIS